MPSAAHSERPLLLLRRRSVLAVSLLAILPFLFAAIPPLIDVPGHMGRFAVQAAEPGDPLLGYFSFRWAPALNLASDLLVEGLRRITGLFAAVWLVCALTPVVTTAGLLLVMRALNPRGAAAGPWALIFVYNIALLWGFLNYALAAGLSLLAFAGWVLLEARPRLRGALYFFLPALLMLGHGVGGLLLPLLIASWEVARRGLLRPAAWRRDNVWSLARTLWPLAGTLLALILWKLVGPAGGGRTAWLLGRKLESPVLMLRDQNMVLDLGTSLAAALVLLLGRLWGARFRGGTIGPVLAVTLLYLAIPSLLLGTDRLDTRLAPLVPMLALALQDWSTVAAPRRRAVALAGTLLLALRFALTTASFAAYDARYTSELAALEQVRPGARVLSLTRNECGLRPWRLSRIDHLSNLAAPLRHAWTNSQWSVGGIHLLGITYRPSDAYYRDPSHYVWPAACIDFRRPFDRRERHTLAEVMRVLPLGGADYLWLIGERLPAGAADPRLRRVWASGDSELYAIVRAP